ncbi:hypothetical protein ScPMuIL_003466 [Solemya velum]
MIRKADNQVEPPDVVVSELGWDIIEGISTDEFTVLAPSNKAFNDMPTSELAKYVADQNKLRDFIWKHVVYGTLSVDNATNDDLHLNVAGNFLRLNKYDQNGVALIEGVEIVDNITTNGGTVYVMDKVLPPLPGQSVMDVIATQPQFSDMFHFIKSAGVQHYFSGDHITAFVPTNEAFTTLGKSLGKHLTSPLLKEILEYHVVNRTIYSAGFYHNQQLTSLNQHHDAIHIKKTNEGYIRVNYAHILEPDIRANNGVIHEINFILVEPRYLLSILAG